MLLSLKLPLISCLACRKPNKPFNNEDYKEADKTLNKSLLVYKFFIYKVTYLVRMAQASTWLRSDVRFMAKGMWTHPTNGVPVRRKTRN